MEIDEEMRRKIVVSFGAVLLLVGAFIAIGVTYGGDGTFSAGGGYALIGAMAAFVLLMAGAGLYLARAG